MADGGGVRPWGEGRVAVGNPPATTGMVTAAPAGAAGRRCLWELDPGLHASIIGTCLSMADLRRIEAGLRIRPPAGATDARIQAEFVAVAALPGLVATALQQRLDDRHRAAIDRFAAAGDRTGVARRWRSSLARGDIAGPYWALLTHPAADARLWRRAFAQVSMCCQLQGGGGGGRHGGDPRRPSAGPR